MREFFSPTTSKLNSVKLIQRRGFGESSKNARCVTENEFSRKILLKFGTKEAEFLFFDHDYLKNLESIESRQNAIR